MIWVLRKRGSAKYALHALFILLYSSVLMSSLASNNVPGSYGYWTAHHLTSWINWTNLMSLYESFFYCSACFECYYIHPQEPATAPTCILIPPYSSRTAPIHQYTPEQNNTPTYSRRLLRMNVITFETCWAKKKNFHKVTSSWFNLFNVPGVCSQVNEYSGPKNRKFIDELNNY